ncbi:MAG: pilus assembly protein [Phycisphaerae bacterium]|nr:pilus assembly protein [Phycisphaerae bacterium]
MKRGWFRNVRERGSDRARGAAIVEFAVILPLLLAILFAIIEFGYVFMIRQSLQHAAREGCRFASLQTSTDAGIMARVDEALSPTGLNGYSVSLTHATQADPVETVSISIPYSDVSLVGGFFGTYNYNLTAVCSMRKEGVGSGS